MVFHLNNFEFPVTKDALSKDRVVLENNKKCEVYDKNDSEQQQTNCDDKKISQTFGSGELKLTLNIQGASIVPLI